MSLRFPLWVKILFWFLLNLVFLALVFCVFLGAQFPLDSLLSGRAGERIQSVADVISIDLGKAPRGDWDNVLDQFSTAYHVRFLLFHNDGEQAAGEETTLPPEVKAKLVTGRGPVPGQMGPPPDGQPRPDDLPPPPGPGMDRERGLEGNPPAVLRGRPPPGMGGRFMLRTSKPGRYWVGVRVRVAGQDRPGIAPMTLLAVSDSIRGGGLFFDYGPWIAVGFGCVLVSVLFWLPLVRGITRSISQIARATEQIADGRFDARVVSKRRDELGRLGQGINQMASRLAGFVSGQKRFLGDIAHELCTPIARIQMALGILEQRADEKQKAYVEDLREEVEHMSNLVNELLSFSKASLGQSTIKPQPVPLRATIEKASRRENFSGADVRIEVDENLRALAEPELLLRSTANLLRNAIRYAAQAGPITVSARREGGRVLVSVADCGPGVPEESLAKLFDPFYRTEPSRTRETGGVGLGLAIVKTCIEA